MIYEVINVIYVLILLLVIQNYYKYLDIPYLLLFVHLVAVYMFNDVLFSPHYMGDQFRYLETSISIRDFLDGNVLESSPPVLISSYIFALFPLPFINSFYSIGLINFMLFIYIFLFSYKHEIFNSRLSLYFYLLFPSIFLYSSVSLRDFLIFVFMYVSFYYILIKNNIKFGLLILSPLIFIKIQNYIIVLVSLLILAFFARKYTTQQKIVLVLLMVVIFIMSNKYFTFEYLDMVRSAMFSDNGGIDYQYVPITSIMDVLREVVPSIIYFLFKPFPWEENNIFNLLQFVENIIVVYLVIHILYSEYRYSLYRDYRIKILNTVLFVAAIVYGLIVYNSGTLVRYKFPFIVIYIMYSLYVIALYKKNKI